MTDERPRPTSTVYAVLLYQPEWYGVAVKIVLWNLGVTMVLLVLCLSLMPGLLMRGIVAVGLIAGAILIHVGLRRSGQADGDLLEIVLRFVIMPRYLGPR